MESATCNSNNQTDTAPLAWRAKNPESPNPGFLARGSHARGNDNPEGSFYDHFKMTHYRQCSDVLSAATARRMCQVLEGLRLQGRLGVGSISVPVCDGGAGDKG